MKKKIILMILGMSLCFSACGQVKIGSLTLGSSAEKEEEPEMISEEISVNVSQTQKENEEAAAQQEKEMRENSMVPSGSQNPSIPVFTDPVIEEEKEYTKEQLSDLIPKNMQQDIDFAHGHATQTVFGQDGEIHITTDTGNTVFDMYKSGSDVWYYLQLQGSEITNKFYCKANIEDDVDHVTVTEAGNYVNDTDTITYLGVSESQGQKYDVVKTEGDAWVKYYFDQDGVLSYMEAPDLSTGESSFVKIKEIQGGLTKPDWADQAEETSADDLLSAFLFGMVAASFGNDQKSDYDSLGEVSSISELAEKSMGMTGSAAANTGSEEDFSDISTRPVVINDNYYFACRLASDDTEDSTKPLIVSYNQEKADLAIAQINKEFEEEGIFVSEEDIKLYRCTDPDVDLYEDTDCVTDTENNTVTVNSPKPGTYALYIVVPENE